MLCPKCGFEQPDALECARCGIIISKYRARVAATAAAQATPGATSALPGQPGPIPPAPQLPPAPIYTPPQVGRAQPAQPPKPSTTAYNAPDAISGSVRTLAANIGPFAALTALATSPIFLYGLIVLVKPNLFGTPFDVSDDFSETLFTQLVSIGIVVLAGVLTTPLATGAVVYGVFQHLRRRPAAFGDCLQVGMRSIFPVLGVAILQGLAISFGLMLCIIPGFFVMVMFYVAIPVAVEERTGAIGAMRRSVELTEGCRMQIFGVVASLAGLNYGVNQLLSILSPEEGFGGVTILMSATTNVFLTALTATASAVTYYQLRSMKESINIDEIATVFD